MAAQGTRSELEPEVRRAGAQRHPAAPLDEVDDARGVEVLRVDGDVAALLAAIERLAGNPAERQVMGERGRQWAEAWRSPESIATTYADLVSDLASRHG